jgi:hypothetical protein
MAGRVDWNGNAFVRQMQAQAKRNTRAACIRLTNHIKAEVSQSGRLVYHPTGKSGKALRRTNTIRNFTHSAPGHPPFTQTGDLRDSIMWELVPIGLGAITDVGRVGSYLKKAKWLELGTRRMKRRPFIVVTLRKNEAEIRSILISGIAAGGLGQIVAIQNRSGILGRGGIAAGYF